MPTMCFAAFSQMCFPSWEHVRFLRSRLLSWSQWLRRLPPEVHWILPSAVTRPTGQVFRYAVAHGLAQSDPVTNVKPSDILPSRKREEPPVSEIEEMPEIDAQIEAYRRRSPAWP
jgi:hypothetical protein